MAIQILPLTIDGWIAPMHSNYIMDWLKSYLESPERTLAGKLVFGDKVFVPTLTVDWGLMRIADYMQFQTFFRKDECNVRFLNLDTNQYEYAWFALQQPSLNRLYTMQSKNDGVLGVKVFFDGTLR